MKYNFRASESTDRLLNNNNFDLLRLLFALVVCLVHARELSGFSELGAVTKYLSSAVAIKSFFVVSGFLIFMSYERSSSFMSYAQKRIRRIYPAYMLVVVGCAVGLYFASSKSASQYFSIDWLKYLLANLSFLNFMQLSLPGVFEGQRWPVVNGALWTLKVEVLFYITVPLFAIAFKRWGNTRIIVSTYCLSVLYSLVLLRLSQGDPSNIYALFARQLPGQLSYFMAGAFLFYNLALFKKHYKVFVVPSLAVLLLDKHFSTEAVALFEPFAIASIAVFSALFIWLGNASKYGDFSYGCYIIHFPIIQLMLHFGWFSESPYWFAIAVVVIVIALSALLWHFVEKRFLFRSSHYLTANENEA